MHARLPVLAQREWLTASLAFLPRGPRSSPPAWSSPAEYLPSAPSAQRLTIPEITSMRPMSSKGGATKEGSWTPCPRGGLLGCCVLNWFSGSRLRVENVAFVSLAATDSCNTWRAAWASFCNVKRNILRTCNWRGSENTLFYKKQDSRRPVATYTS